MLRHAPIRLEFTDDLLEGRPVRGPGESGRPPPGRCAHQILGRPDLGLLAARLAAAASPSTANLSADGLRAALIGGT
jgi:hypothetical protein